MADLLDQATGVDQGLMDLSLMAGADFDRDTDGRRTHSSKETSDYLTIDLLKTERYDLNKTATENLKKFGGAISTPFRTQFEQCPTRKDLAWSTDRRYRGIYTAFTDAVHGTYADFETKCFGSLRNSILPIHSLADDLNDKSQFTPLPSEIHEVNRPLS